MVIEISRQDKYNGYFLICTKKYKLVYTKEYIKKPVSFYRNTKTRIGE